MSEPSEMEAAAVQRMWWAETEVEKRDDAIAQLVGERDHYRRALEETHAFGKQAELSAAEMAYRMDARAYFALHCDTCHGSGLVRRGADGNESAGSCPTCGGDGQRYDWGQEP